MDAHPFRVCMGVLTRRVCVCQCVMSVSCVLSLETVAIRRERLATGHGALRETRPRRLAGDKAMDHGSGLEVEVDGTVGGRSVGTTWLAKKPEGAIASKEHSRAAVGYAVG